MEEISPELHAFLSRATALHIGALLQAAGGVAQQRRDPNRRLPGMTTDGCTNIMQQLAVIRCGLRKLLKASAVLH